MMKQIKTEIVIDKDISTVWNVLVYFENHPNWNPFIKSIKGKKSVGEKLIVTIKLPDGKGMTFKPIVLKYEPNKEFRWKGKLGITGIFDGEHFFILEKLNDNQTKFIHGENFNGILVSLMGGGTLDKTGYGFELMNQALKKECEKLNN